VSALIRRHPLPAFFVLSYAFSWWAVPFGAFLPFGPLLGALVVTAVIDGRSGLRALGSRLVRWRVGWRWYAVAVGLPLTVVLGAITVNIGLGAPASALDDLDPWYLLVLIFVVRLINPLDGPLGEEPGWRGFALARLQHGRSPLHAGLILGLLVAGWHLPLVFLPGEELPPVLLLATVAVTFVYTWIFNRTGDSAFMTLVTHAAEGTITLGALGFVAADESRVTALYAAAWCAVAIGLLVFDWRFWRGPSPSSQPAVPSQPLVSSA
jgi:membrane protease YdiL (CAAX protease family)